MKVVNDPNVITVVRELPKAYALVNAIYHCDYSAFFKAVSALYCTTPLLPLFLIICSLYWDIFTY